jgi:hypothetical protein
MSLGAQDGVPQIDFDGRFGVVSRDRFGGAAPGPRAAALAPPEEVLEHRSQIGRIETRAAGEPFKALEPPVAEAARAGLALELASLLFVEAGAGGDLAELVVQRALLGVAQDLERGGDLLEAFLGLLVPRVHVRMELLRQLPVRLLDLLRRRRLRHAEGGVRILHHCATVTTRRRVVKWGLRIPRCAAPSVTIPV